MSRNLRTARGFPTAPILSRSGARPGAAGGAIVPVQLLSLDFSSPTQQTLATTATGIMSGRTFDDVFTFEDATNLVSSIGSETLTAQGNVVTQRVAPGFFDGTDLVSKLGANVQVNDTAAGWEAGNNTFWDVTTESVVFLGVFRMRPGTQSPRLFTKLVSEGYNLLISNIGRFTWTLDPGTAQNLTNTGQHRDGCWQAFIAGRDQNAVLTFVRSLRFDATAALTATGTITVAAPFQIGEPDFAEGADAQWAYLARATGADAEGLAQSDLTSWWTHGNPPTGMTYTRAGNLWTVVDDDVTFGLQVAPWSIDEVPTGYRSGLAAGFGMEFAGAAITNLADTDIATNWTHTTITATAKNGDSPDRFDDSHLLTATAGNGTSHYDMTTVVSTTYAAGIFYKRSGGSDVTFDLELQRSDTQAVLATTQLTATSKWQRAEVSAAAATTTTRMLVRVITNTEAIEVWHPQLHVGTYLRSVVGAYTAAGGTSSAATATIDNSGNVYLDSIRGEIEIVCIKDAAPTADEMLFQVRGVTDDDDRLDVLIQSDDTLKVTVYTSTGASKGTATTGAITWTTEQTIRVRWNSAAAISGYAQFMDVIVNGSRTASNITTSWTASTGGDEAHVGAQYDGTDPFSGVISSIATYDQERPD